MKFRQFSTCIALMMVINLTSCKNNFDDPSAGMTEKNDQQIRDYLNFNQLLKKITPTTSGLYYTLTDTTSTRNKKAQYNEELEFTYTLSYIDGNKTVLLDSANQTKSAFIPFIQKIVVPGFEEGLLLMKEGQRGLFFMPSNLAFGKGNTTIPEYVPVVFDVELKHSRTESEQILAYATSKKLGLPTFKAPVKDAKDSVWVYRLTQGAGPKITVGKTVTVAYNAHTLRGSTPFEKQDAKEINTETTQSSTIVGLVTGLTQLNVGDKALFVFASSLGYGKQGIVEKSSYLIPPYSPLVYEVTVNSAK